MDILNVLLILITPTEKKNDRFNNNKIEIYYY